MKTIERAEYLQWLERWKDKQIIKVVQVFADAENQLYLKFIKTSF